MAGRTLADAIAFNVAHASVEMPFFGQENFEVANLADTSGPDVPQPVFGGISYNEALDAAQSYGVNGIDLALSQFHLDAIVAPTTMPAGSVDLLTGDIVFFASSTLAAVPGYPIVEVPAANVLGLPMGVSFFGTAFSEPTLIKLASGFEAVTRARTEPTFAPTLPNDHISGVPLVRPHRRSRVDSDRPLRRI